MSRRPAVLWPVAVLALNLATVPSPSGAGAADGPVSRVPQVQDAEAAPAVARIFAAIRAGGSEPLTMHRAVANAPELFVAYVGMARAIRADAQVPRADRELVILRTLQIEGGAYEFDQHAAMARSCGISPAQIAALADWRGASLFDPRQRAVLAWAEAMATREGPGDAEYRALAAILSPRETVELTLTAAFYAASARTTKALGVAPDPAAASVSRYGAC